MKKPSLKIVLPPAHPECIAAAKKLLEDCEAGRIKAFAVAYVDPLDQAGSSSVLSPPSSTLSHILGAAVSKLYWAYTRALVDVDKPLR